MEASPASSREIPTASQQQQGRTRQSSSLLFLFILKSKSQREHLSSARGGAFLPRTTFKLAPPSPIAARAERAEAPAPASARAPIVMRGLGPFFSVVQGAVTETQVFGSHVAISGLAIFRYGLA